MTKPFDIVLGKGGRVSGEYKPGEQIVIFSHGFDVKRDSDGLFSNIAENLPANYGYVLFDYHTYEGSTETLRSLSEQSSVLHHVITWARKHLNPKSLHLIAHSMGCTVASYAGDTAFSSVTYLAPGMRSGSGLRRFFTEHKGARQKGKYWNIQRRGGKTTRISEAFF